MNAGRGGNSPAALGALLEAEAAPPPAALAAIVARRHARARRRARRGGAVGVVVLVGAGTLVATLPRGAPSGPPDAPAVALAPARVLAGTAAVPMASAARAPDAATAVGAVPAPRGLQIHPLPALAGRLVLAGGASCRIGETVLVSGAGESLTATAPAQATAAIWSVSAHVVRAPGGAHAILAARVGPGVHALSLEVPGEHAQRLDVRDGWALAQPRLPATAGGELRLRAVGSGARRGASVRLPIRSGTFVAASCAARTPRGHRGG